MCHNLLMVGIAFAAVILSGCFNDQDGRQIYGETEFVVLGDTLHTVRFPISKSGRCRLFSKVELNGAVLELDKLTSENVKEFFDKAKIACVMDNSENPTLIRDARMEFLEYADENGVRKISIQEGPQLTLRATGEAITLPIKRTEMINILGVPDSIRH